MGARSNRPISLRVGVAGQLLSSEGTDTLFGVGSPAAAEAHLALTWRPHRKVEPVPQAERAPDPSPSARVVWVPHQIGRAHV